MPAWRRAEVIDYLRALGVTAVELLPVHTFVDDSYLLDKGLRNYWGYNTIGFFAPDPRYAGNADFAFAEFKEMVAHLHDAGLEVILDVVYNHTAEGNELGPTLSFKGIDNASYYRLLPDEPRYYINDTGTGNTREPQQSARAADGDGQPALLGAARCTSTASASTSPPSSAASRTASTRTAASSMPAGRTRCCRQVKLIAEPWDCGPGGYQVGALLAGLGRMERPLSATRCAPTGGATRASCRSSPRG